MKQSATVGYMAEDKIQDKDAVNQAPKEETSSKEENSPEKKTGGAFSEMFGLFKKSKPKGDKPEGSAKSVPEIKKTAIGKPAAFSAQKIKLKTVNQALIAVLVGLVVLMFYITLREKPEISSVVAAISSIKLPEVETKIVVVFKDLPYYLAQIKKRDIFSIFKEKKEVFIKIAEPIKEPEPPPTPVVPIETKAKNIKLIGISWGKNPKAMIRNTSTQSVQFVSIGEKIDGTDIKIIEIFKNEVVLGSEGQEMSLM